MNAALLLLCLAAPLPQPAEGTVLTYEGTLLADKGLADRGLADNGLGENGESPRKQFELHLVVEDATAAAPQWFWSLDEMGGGQWHWTSRYGRVSFDVLGHLRESTSPELLLVRESGSSQIPLRLPYWTAKPLASGQSWKEEKVEFQVQAGGKKSGIDTWKVVSQGPYGHLRTLWVDKARSLVVAMEESVVIGQGERHTLKYQLISSQVISGEPLAQRRKAHQQLLDLRAALGVEAGTRDVLWTADQLQGLRTAAEKLPESEGAVAQLVKAIREDARFQRNRSGALMVMRKKVVGQRLPDFQFATTDRKQVDNGLLAGKVSVLHFWTYQNSPLEQPYGQVGFLDFLHRRLESDQVQLLGIAAHPRLREAESRQQGVVSARKFKDFMRLGYPVALDTEGYLANLGDPRAAGAELPLVLVVDREGKVIHYHTGFYEVDRVRGLAELEDVVKKALGTEK